MKYRIKYIVQNYCIIIMLTLNKLMSKILNLSTVYNRSILCLCELIHNSVFNPLLVPFYTIIDFLKYFDRVYSLNSSSSNPSFIIFSKFRRLHVCLLWEDKGIYCYDNSPKHYLKSIYRNYSSYFSKYP